MTKHEVPSFIDHRTGLKTKKKTPILTIATAVINDFGGFSFTLINLVNQLGSRLDEVEFVVVDNSPDTGHGLDTKDLAKSKLPNCNYVSLEPRRGTFAAKEVGILAAQTEFVLFIDSHVLLQDGVIEKLLWFCNNVGSTNDLFHGPLMNERWNIHATHMNPMLSKLNFGRWGTYRNENKSPLDNCEYYEVPLHGMGLFFVRRDAWLGFNPALFGFGSEEGYIHEKYRLHGRKCWSIPFLKWWHLFRRNSIEMRYETNIENKYRNYLISWKEVGLPIELIEQAFKNRISVENKKIINDNVESLNIRPIPYPKDHIPFLGYPIRLDVEGRKELEDYKAYEKNIIFAETF